MTEETPAVDTPEAHAPHAHHTGHRWVDFTLALAALSVSLISLWVAVHHGKTMEKLVQANSMPNVEIEPRLLEEDASQSLSFNIDVTNSGVGPARIESIELWDGDRALASVGDIAENLKNYSTGESLLFQFGAKSTQGTLLGAGKESRMLSFQFKNIPASRENLFKALEALQTRVCYCSVFDECFEADSRNDKGRPARVERCEVRAGAFDEDVSTFLEAMEKYRKTTSPPPQDPPK